VSTLTRVQSTSRAHAIDAISLWEIFLIEILEQCGRYYGLLLA
jgi:hypothetical protein